MTLVMKVREMKPLQGPIGPYPRSEVRDLRNERIPVCWVGAPPAGSGNTRARATAPASPATGAAGGEAPLAPVNGVNGTDAASVRKLLPASGPLLFAFAPAPPDEALAALAQALERGERVYVVASPGFGEGGEQARLWTPPTARVLVRRTTGLPLSAVVGERGRHALVWMGAQPSSKAAWRLRLSPSQGVALFQALLHLFWHHAFDEAWVERRRLVFRKVAKASEAPFQAPEPAPEAPVALSLSALPLPAGDLWHAPDGVPPVKPAQPRLVLLPPSGKGLEALAALAHGGTHVAWQDLGLPACSLQGERGAVVLRHEARHVRISLEAPQVQALARFLHQAADTAPWHLRCDVARGEIDRRGEVWLPGAPEPAPIVEHVAIECPEAKARELAEVPETPPPSRPTIPPLALAVEWQWVVKPPRAQRGAKEDPLAAEWHRLDEEFAQRTGAAREGLQRIEKDEGRLGKAFEALTPALLGLGRKRSELLRALGALASQRPSHAGPERARELLEALGHLEQEADRLSGELREAERKELERKEWDEQRRAWEKQRAAAERRLPQLAEELQRVEAALGAADDGLVKARQIEDKKDRKAREHQLRDEQKRLQAQMSALEAERDGAKALVAQTEPPYRPASALAPAGQAGNKGNKGNKGHQDPKDVSRGPASGFVPQAAARKADEVPVEALPAVGQLLLHQTTRYLAIERWEDLEAGEREARRLRARVVALPEAS